ncbi:ARM repeat-containing protein [Linnemannia elongata AG-77]|uniref:ARM repeat-containing protein n=1 Tax=Linnemannia elongata AG-77 TaxID=1314771 RepID=A0A197JYZ7_9FUNG|nr:ARM repeat-containing protein [Linnemannia elongata AG-77]
MAVILARQKLLDKKINYQRGVEDFDFGHFFLSEEGETPHSYGSAPEENFTAIPVQERLDHKNWKARVSAYEELAKLFRTSVEDSDFRRYEGSLKKIALDSNAVAQESGLTTLIQFVENAPDPNRTKNVVVPAVVEKCLSSTRAGTKAKALELILLYVEVDSADPVIEDVLPGLDAKLPKLVATTTNVLTSIIRTFGIKNLNVKPLVKKLPPLFGHSDKNVRAEANAMTIELYRWLGKAIMPSLEDLKPVQQKELTEAFEKLPDERPTPQRYLRSQQAEMAAAAAAAEAGDGGADDAEAEKKKMPEVDAQNPSDPVDVNAKMEKNFYELLASKKWQERKEALDALLVLCNSPKILDSHYSELVGALGKRMADTNINTVIVAANCLEGLARGLRDSFNKYKPSVAGLVMDRLKERKVTVVEALAGALNAMYSTIRSPSKVETVKLLCQTLILQGLIDDADATVREATAEALGTLMKLLLPRQLPLLLYTDKLHAAKKSKLLRNQPPLDKALVQSGKSTPTGSQSEHKPSVSPVDTRSWHDQTQDAPPREAAPAADKEDEAPERTIHGQVKKPLGKAPCHVIHQETR